MNGNIELQAADGHRLQAYQARPSQARAGLVVVQEIFGVNGHMRSMCDRFAAQGYLAVSPALYDRAERGVELAYGPEGVARGREIRKSVTDEIALRDVAAAVEHCRKELGADARVGVVGYCWGGTLAWLSATRLDHVSAAVGYYGSGIAGYLAEKPRCPVMLHFGLKDASIPNADVDKIKAGYPQMPVYQYEAGHGFNCDDRAAYDAPSAKTAGERTEAFFAEHLLRQKARGA